MKLSGGNTVQWYHCSQCQWRNPPNTIPGQITSINTCSCASIMRLFTYMFMQTVWFWHTSGHILFIMYCLRQNTENWCGCGIDLRHEHRDELPSYLFIQAFLSITAIISITHSDFEKMKDAFPPIFNLEVATMAMMNVWIVHLLPLISPNLSWQLRYCLPGNLLYNNCYCDFSPSF